MKKIVVIICCMTCWQLTHAQTFAEWFFQKKTQRKYLLQQIAALEAYIKVLEKGYDIVKDGLKVVHDLKEGDFKLHDLHFTSLRSISDPVAKAPEVSRCHELIQLLKSQLLAIQKNVRQISSFSTEEAQYATAVCQHLLIGVVADEQQLSQCTTAGTFTMEDAERLTKLNGILADLEDRYAFVGYFARQVNIMAVQRGRESRDTRSLYHLFDIK